MKILLHSVAAAAIAISLSGCIVIGGNDHDDNDSTSWRAEQRRNNQQINDLQVNDSRVSVIERLGAPSFSEAFMRGDDEYRVLFYRTRHRHSDGETSRDETTPLVFKNDHLTGWGEDTLAAVR